MTSEISHSRIMSNIGLQWAPLIGPVGAGGAVIAYCTGNWLGKLIFRSTGRTLTNILPRGVSHGLHDIIGSRIAIISEWCESKTHTRVGLNIVTPILEEFTFRGGQLLSQYIITNYFKKTIFTKTLNHSLLIIWAFVFSYCHNSGQPGRDMGLFFTGLIFGGLLKLNPGLPGLLFATLAHSLFNMNPITPTLKVVRQVEK